MDFLHVWTISHNIYIVVKESDYFVSFAFSSFSFCSFKTALRDKLIRPC